MSPLSRAEVLLKLTALLERERVPYCLLGDTRHLPEEIPGDIDIAVAQECLYRIPELLQTFCTSERLVLAQVFQHELTAYYYTLAWVNPATASDGLPQFLNPDICGDYYHIGRFYLTSEELLAGREAAMDDAGHPKGFLIPAATSNFIYYLIKKIDKQDLSLRSGAFLSNLWRQDPVKARTSISRFWPAAEAELLADAADKNTWEPVITRLPALQTALRRNRPFDLRVALQERARKLRRLFQPTGLMVAFMGPDGAGKSSVIEQTLASLASAFRRTTRVHLRPSLGRKQSDGKTITDPHGKPPYGWWLSLAKLAYLWFDYTLGYGLRIYPPLARSTLVVFDRYYQDLLVDPHRYRFGGSPHLARWLARLIPQPNLWIFLDAPPEVLRARKQEVSPEETARQCQAYRRLATGLPNAVVVDASQNLAHVVAEVDKAILYVLANRTRERSNKTRKALR